MNFPPRAFIIGAQKAATTSLAFLLDQHPSIRLSNPKETHFFSVNWEEGEGWYRAKFSNPTDDVLLLDASTSYAMAPIGDNRPDSSKRPRWGQSVPERIHGYAENAKFIYMLRKPADRTYSAYWHNVRSGQEKMPFRDAIEAHPVYLETSKYHAQIAIFLKHFDLKEFYLVDFKIFPVIRASTRPPVWNFSNYPNATSNSSWKSKKINHFNIIRSAGRCRECSVRTKVSNRPTS